MDLGQLQAQEGNLWHFLFILWANASVYSRENSRWATSNADLSSLSCSHLCWLPPVDWSLLLPSPDCVLPLTALSCRLVSSAPIYKLFSRTFLPSSLRSRRRSHAQTLCVGFAPKQIKRFFNWHPLHTYSTNAQHLLTLLFLIAMMPLNHILRKGTAGYKLSKFQEKIDHLVYIDDI